MKRTTALTVFATAFALLLSRGARGQSDGKAVFMAHCQRCHSVASEGIQPGGFERAVNINWKSRCDDCTPDLTGVGARRKADWLKAYLKNEKKGRNGLKHNQIPIRQNGNAYILEDSAREGSEGILPRLTAQEADAVVGWLMTVKKATAETAAAGAAQPPLPPRPPSKAKAVPLPKEEAANLLRSAKTVAVIGETGRQIMDRAFWNPDGERAKRNVEEVMTVWGRYNVVPQAGDADLVIVLTEYQKNLQIVRIANLVCEMRVYRGGGQPAADAPVVWSGDASEGLQQPSKKVAEKFRDFVKGLPAR